GGDAEQQELELARATEQEKESQLKRVHDFRTTHRDEAARAIARLKEAAINGDNVFEVLMDAARVCSLQQVTEAFFEVGGQYRRNVCRPAGRPRGRRPRAGAAPLAGEGGQVVLGVPPRAGGSPRPARRCPGVPTTGPGCPSPSGLRPGRGRGCRAATSRRGRARTRRRTSGGRVRGGAGHGRAGG